MCRPRLVANSIRSLPSPAFPPSPPPRPAPPSSPPAFCASCPTRPRSRLSDSVRLPPPVRGRCTADLGALSLLHMRGVLLQGLRRRWRRPVPPAACARRLGNRRALALGHRPARSWPPGTLQPGAPPLSSHIWCSCIHTRPDPGPGAPRYGTIASGTTQLVAGPSVIRPHAPSRSQSSGPVRRPPGRVPARGPIILACAPHANQFVDPIVVLRALSHRRDVGFLAAAKTMRKQVLGDFARAMDAIPVERPQDLARAARVRRNPQPP